MAEQARKKQVRITAFRRFGSRAHLTGLLLTLQVGTQQEVPSPQRPGISGPLSGETSAIKIHL